MLPREAYVDDAVFAWEQRAFFEGGWMCVGRSEDVAVPGDQRAESTGRAGVFLVRDGDGAVRGFANACRHRGHELLPCGESRNLRMVVCPYHSWSYHLDGTLRGAPGFDVLGGFAAEDHGLVELPTEEWHGLLFVDASGGAGPLADHVRGVERFVAPYEPERLRAASHHDYVVASNWKVLGENYQECYHCAMIHPELCRVSPPRSGENYPSSGGGAWVGGWMSLADGAKTMSLDGRPAGSPLRGLDRDGRRQVIYLVIFPNVLLSLHPDYVMTHILTPLSPDRTRVRCTWAFAPEDLERADFDSSGAIDFWDTTNRQDWAACESVQRGMSSPHHVPGPLSPDEDGVYHFVTMLARGYRGRPLGT
jgi:Rieske 2Fe-2S family protein